MNIDDLKSKAEDIAPVEEPELTPEQKEIQEKFFRSAVLRKFRSTLKGLYEQMKRKKRTIAEVKQSIINKDKTNSFSQRDREFIMGFKDEFLVTLLKDMYGRKELNEIDLTVSEIVSSGIWDTGNVQSDS